MCPELTWTYKQKSVQSAQNHSEQSHVQNAAGESHDTEWLVGKVADEIQHW